MKVLLDECVPKPLAQKLEGVTVLTTHQMGWASKKNGDLIALAENEFDVFITSDQNLSYQQNLAKRNIAIILLSTNRWKIISDQTEKITIALSNIKGKEFIEVTF